MKLEEFLLEIKLSNINPMQNLNVMLHQKITEKLIYNANFLMKLSLTKINLNDFNTVDNLCYLFQKKKHL